MFSRASADELRSQLRDVEAQLEAHAYNTPEAMLTREITERYRDEGEARIEKELADRGLPSLKETGKIVARGLWSYAKLEKRKRKLQQKIASIGG
ncbi:MAG: hypothetical protein B5766_01775 [Candidatus Lumbricidophila eiseniae]|uniref:Uncharacterized protein n=1 Tax=Candidatus Lumbricidiphila eiseniae TaxID=1969409 RepID=A0A2A6FTX3_9MICO|nr:MAG: hypothetical protein B5766_01775 [Candidatus Lumbricidophila eiseniae]